MIISSSDINNRPYQWYTSTYFTNSVYLHDFTFMILTSMNTSACHGQVNSSHIHRKDSIIRFSYSQPLPYPHPQHIYYFVTIKRWFVLTAFIFYNYEIIAVRMSQWKMTLILTLVQLHNNISIGIIIIILQLFTQNSFHFQISLLRCSEILEL